MATDFNNAGTSQSTQLEKVKTSDADFMTSSDSSPNPIFRFNIRPGQEMMIISDHTFP